MASNFDQKQIVALKDDQMGTSMLQFAMVFPILMLIIFGIIDTGRYFAVKGLLNSGAEEAINLATKIPNYDVNLTGLKTSDQKYSWYTQARDKILNKAENIPTSTLLTRAASPSDSTLLSITMRDENLSLAGGENVPELTRNAAVLRPGDCVAVQGMTDPYCNREGMLYPESAYPLKEDPREVMKHHPILVVIFARVRTFLPFIGPVTAVGTARGYREDGIPPVPFVLPVAPPAPGATPYAGGPLPPVLPAAGATETPTPYGPCIPPSSAKQFLQWCIEKRKKRGADETGSCILKNIPDEDGRCESTW